ncbi:hypothetical protein FACS189487_10420 [Campylobacterota bacterium]|nr:hypothetical protein FACS189487_10420 [Campylobacterota bacterium]
MAGAPLVIAAVTVIAATEPAKASRNLALEACPIDEIAAFAAMTRSRTIAVKVPQGRHLINRGLQPTDNANTQTKVPHGTTLLSTLPQ